MRSAVYEKVSTDGASPFLDLIACAGFLVLFPGFVIYHFAVIASWVPPFAGGLFGVASAFLMLFAMVHLSGHVVQPKGVPGLEHVVIAFITYLFAWTIMAGLMIADRPYAMVAVSKSLATLAIWLTVYFTAVRLRLGSRVMTGLMLLSAATVVVLFLLAAWEQQSFFGPFLMFKGIDAWGERTTTYQGIGRSILVLAVALSCVQRSLARQLLVFGFAVVALLVLGSRAHLFAALLLAVALVGARGLRYRNRLTAFSFLSLLLLTGYWTSGFLLETRAAEILSLGESTSWQLRLTAQNAALEVIASNPFLGSFGYYLSSDSAGYSHNILSAWAEFGAVAFLVYLGLMVYALAVSGQKVLFRRDCTPLWLASFHFSLAALALAIASEPIFGSVLPALGWGCVVNAIYDDGRRRCAAVSLQGRNDLDGQDAAGPAPRGRGTDAHA